jgi:hypothetical protein
MNKAQQRHLFGRRRADRAGNRAPISKLWLLFTLLLLIMIKTHARPVAAPASEGFGFRLGAVSREISADHPTHVNQFD